MADQIIGLDPKLVENCDFDRRRDVANLEGVAPGTPVRFQFDDATSLAGWTANYTGADSGESISAGNGDLVIKGQDVDGAYDYSATATYNTKLLVDQTVATIAFELMAEPVTGQTAAMIRLPGGIGIGLPECAYFHLAEDAGRVPLGVASAVGQSNNRHKIVIAIQSNKITVWEDDVQKVQLTVDTPYGPEFEMSFGLGGDYGSAMCLVSELAVLIGSTQIPRQKRGTQTQSVNAIKAKAPGYAAIADHLSDLETAAASILSTLRQTDVGVSSLFWGISVSNDTKHALTQLTQHPSYAAAVSAAQTHFGGRNRSNTPFTFSISIGMSASFLISGAYELGFLFGDGRIYAFLDTSGGIVTNAGVQGNFEAAFYIMNIEDVLGWGSYVEIGAGEVIQGSFAIAGGLPLPASGWVGCGPAFYLGVGASVSPLEIGAGIGYTFKMATV